MYVCQVSNLLPVYITSKMESVTTEEIGVNLN